MEKVAGRRGIERRGQALDGDRRGFQSVTAPWLASLTCAAYFASTPVVYLGFGAFHFALRRAISALETFS